MMSATKAQSMELNKNSFQQDNVNDKSALLSEGDRASDIEYNNENDDTASILSTTDEIMDSVKIGLFHYLIVITCGLCFSGYGVYYQLLGLIIITACDLNINATSKAWLSISLMIGIIPGTILFGGLADIYGRRKLLLFVVFLALISALASAFAYNSVMLSVMTGLVGCSYGGICAIIHSYVIEFFPRNYRGIAGSCVSAFTILGNVYGCVIGLVILPHSFHIHIGSIYFTNWRLYLLIAMIPTLVGFCMLFFMPNSLRFVLTKQEKKDVIHVLDKIDRINSCYQCCGYKPTSRQSKSIQSMIMNSHCDDIDISNIKNTTSHQYQSVKHARKLMKQPWRKRLTLLSITWFGYCFSDKGFLIWIPTVLSYYISGNTCRHRQHNAIHNMSINMTHSVSVNSLDCYSSENLKAVIVNLLIGNALCIPLTISCIVLINRVGRKLLYSVMGLTCGLNLILICSIDNLLSTTILSCIFMSFAAAGWIPVKIWSLELFSTDIRSTAIGFLNVLAYVGCALGMVTFILLFDTNCTATFIIFGSIALLAVVSTLFLPDTTNASID